MADDNTDKTDKTLGQQYHEAVEALKASGMKNADAVRQVAADFEKEEGAVRGGIHQYKTKLAGGNGSAAPRGRRPATISVEDHIANARTSLEEAKALIEREVEQAKSALDAAQEHYDAVTPAVKERKADIEKKLKALA